MQLQLIGQLLEVKPVESTDKKTGKVHYSTQIQVQFAGIDEKGYKTFTTESISLDEDDYDILDPLIGNYVCITYTIIHGKDRTFVFPDKDMPVLTFDKNPLDYSKFKRPSKTDKK